MAPPGEAQRRRPAAGPSARAATSAQPAAARARPVATQDATARRLRLAQDPANNSLRLEEADAALAAEAAGLLAAPVTRSAHPGADFVDGKGQLWDVKAFRSASFLPRPLRPGQRVGGAFTLAKAMTLIAKELHRGQRIIVDTRFLTAQDLAALRAEVVAHHPRDHVVWVAPSSPSP